MNDALGQACALATAVTWATALVLFKRCGDTVGPLALNLFKNSIGIVLLVLTLVLMGDGTGALQGFPRADLYILMLSGIIGIAIADTIFFYSLNLIGVGIISIVDCVYSPLAILFAWLLLSEALAPAHYLGAVLILGSVLTATRLAPPPGRTGRQLMVGILVAIFSMALMAFGIVGAKLVLNDFPLFWATLLRLTAGTLALAALAAASPKRRDYFAVFRPGAVWKTAIPASVLGAYLAMVLWVAGFKYTQAGLASLLNQTSVIFALVLASVFLKERFTRRKLVAMVLGLSGVVLVVTAPF
ncbi:MAG: DMT family transporter [bacterium]|nr:DMT family transporter [bacterium]